MLLKNMIHFLRVSVQLQITLTGVFHWSTCVFLNYGFHFHFSLSCIGEGNGNPLQYSCLGNLMIRGVWQAIDHRVAESDMTEVT